MFLSRSEYDRGVNTYSPEGRLFQIEYAIEAIKLGSTVVGISTFEGVVLAAEKRITSTLMVPEAIEKIMVVSDNIVCVGSGLMADSRTLMERARVEGLNHWFTYDEQIMVESMAQVLSNVAIQFGDSDEESSMSRPFGVSILVAGVDNKGPQLYHMDPSGTSLKFDAKAIGSGSEGAQQSLQEMYHKNITINEASAQVLTILKQVMEEKLSTNNVEIVVIKPGTGCHQFTKAELEEALQNSTAGPGGDDRMKI